MPKREPNDKGGSPLRTSNGGSANLLQGFSDRMRAVRARLAKTQPEMDQLLGIGKRSWQKYEAEGVIPRSSVVAELVRLGWSANWLLGGIGPARIDETAGLGNASPPGVAPLAPGVAGGSTIRVVLSREWLERRGVRDSDLVQAYQPDDSMAPTVPRGDLVVADGRVERVDADGLYLVQLEAAPQVVRIQRGSADELRLLRDSPLYRESTITPGELESALIGRVIWIGGER